MVAKMESDGLFTAAGCPRVGGGSGGLLGHCLHKIGWEKAHSTCAFAFPPALVGVCP